MRTQTSRTAAAPPPPPPFPALDEQFTGHLLEALIHFRDGDFAHKMPANLVGVQGKIADVFNEIVTLTDRRTNEVERVSRMVGKEGKLKERMRALDSFGTSARIVNAINTLVDDLVGPAVRPTGHFVLRDRPRHWYCESIVRRSRPRR